MTRRIDTRGKRFKKSNTPPAFDGEIRHMIDPNDLLQGGIYSDIAEKAVLASMMSRPEEVIENVTDRLGELDFFIPAHRDLFRVVVDMFNKQEPIDITTLHQRLVDDKLAASIGSPGYLAELAAGLATHLNVSAYIRIVKEKSYLKKLQEHAAYIAEAVQEGNAANALEVAESGLSAITDGQTRAKERTWAEIVFAANLAAKAPAHTRGGILTGFRRFDELTGGLRGGEMVVIGARPGMGKTSLAWSWAINIASRRYDAEEMTWQYPGEPVGFFSLEMLPEQMAMKALAIQSGLDTHRLRTSDLNDGECSMMDVAADTAAQWPMHISEQPNLNLTRVRNIARMWKRKYGIKILVLDYIQLLKEQESGGGGYRASENRQVEVANISRALKLLAVELLIPIIVCAQLSRESEKGTSQRPALHNLRESGAIEQDADMVLFPYRENVEDGKHSGVPYGCTPYTLIVAKHRLGAPADIPMLFKSRSSKFEEAP